MSFDSMRDQAARARRWLKRRQLLPPAARLATFRELLPKRWYHGLSAVLLWAAMLYVLRATWGQACTEMCGIDTHTHSVG
jgi:hypothetical protein